MSYIDEMTRKEKKEALKSEINTMADDMLDAWLEDLGYEYSDEEEED